MNRRGTRRISALAFLVCTLAGLVALLADGRAAIAQLSPDAADAVPGVGKPAATASSLADPSSAVSVFPAKLAFEPRAVGTQSGPQTVTLTNRLHSPLRLSPASATGDFAVAKNACGLSLAAGKSCAVSVIFAPKRPGALTGTLTLPYRAAGGPGVVSLRGESTTATLTSIAVTPADPSVVAGTAKQFTAAGSYSNGSTRDLTAEVTWSSSTAAVATIGNASSSHGLAIANAAGTTTITATSGTISGSTKLTVTAPVLESIAITPANPSIPIGATQQFTATGTYNNGAAEDVTASATWSSSSPAVAAVSNAPGTQGLAHASAIGTTAIAAVSGTVKGTTTLTVPNSFLPTGSLNTPRTYHTATMLNNGLVLIVGGYGTSGALAGAELYNPATGTFALTGSLNTARWLHTATLLNNGMVLIAGGCNASIGGYLATAELYNPSTGTFSIASGALNTARDAHTATLLQNGTVLLAGGYSSSGYVYAAEIFDPTNRTFMPTGNLNSPRASHSATLLNDGTVLIAGGNDGYGYFNAAEIFNPLTGSFSYTTTGLITARSQHTATLLNDGQVLIAGGIGAGGFVAGAELYNVFTGIFTPAGSLNTARDSHIAALLTNGNVLVAGGESFNGYLAGAEIFNPSTSTFTPAGSVPNAVGSATATQLGNGQVLIAGGFGADGYFDAAALYSPDPLTPPGLVSIAVTDAPLMFSPAQLSPGTNQQYFALGTFSDGSTAQLASVVWSSATTQDVVISNDATNAGSALTVGSAAAGTHVVITATAGSVSGVTAATLRPAGFVSGGILGTNRAFHTAILLNNGLVLIAGGVSVSGAPLASAELYNPATNTFAPTGSMILARYDHTATLLTNGMVLIAGGFFDSAQDPTSEAELYNPATGTFTQTGFMNAPRASHTATLLNDGQVLIAGGFENSKGITLITAELYDPGEGEFSFTANGIRIYSSVNQTATLLPNGTVLIAGGYSNNPDGSLFPAPFAELYQPVDQSFSQVGELNTGRAGHAASLLPNGQVLIAGGFVASPAGPAVSAELYNPAAQAFTVTGGMNSARELQTATLLNSGLVLMAGGTFKSPETEELYNPATGAFAATGSSLSTAIAAHTATLLNNGMVLLAGGETPGLTVLNTADLY